MKILFLTTGYYPHVGGKSTHIESLVLGFSKIGVTAGVVSLNDVQKMKRFQVLHFLSKPLKLISKERYFLLTYRLITTCMAKLLSRLFLDNQYDAVCAQDPHSALACYKANNSIPITLTMHTYFGLEYLLSDEMHENSEKYQKKLRYVENTLTFVKAVLCVDSRIRQHVCGIANNLNLKDLKIITIKNFTNTDVFAPGENKELRQKLDIKQNTFVGICARRMVEKNGVIFAIKTMELFDDKDNIQLIVCGDGVERSRIEKEIEEYHLEKCIKLVGAVNNHDLIEYYHAADFAIVPSITVNGLQEATSITAIESMSCGLPTIASDIGGLHEMIKNDFNGILVPEQSPDRIKQAILKLKNDSDYYNYISKESRKDAEINYSYISAAREYRDAIESII